MVGYISEFQYVGQSTDEFIEVVLPAGTDPTGYTVQIYMADGTLYQSFPIGSSVATVGGQDVYLVDASTPGFFLNDGDGSGMGNLYPDDGIALVDGAGTVQQFISYDGNVVTATEGAAAGQTSQSVGGAGFNQSLQSDDGGNTYYTQSSPNPGAVPAPACYAPGTLIRTPGGQTPIEALRAGAWILTARGHARQVKWIWSRPQMLVGLKDEYKPVLIRAGALGAGRPAQDLVVSGQHRIVVGGFGQLEQLFDGPVMVPAKALVALPGVRFMAGVKRIDWHHLLCERHEVVVANGAVSESLLPGPEFQSSITAADLVEVRRALGHGLVGPVCPAMECLPVGVARRRIRAARKATMHLA